MCACCVCAVWRSGWLSSGVWLAVSSPLPGLPPVVLQTRNTRHCACGLQTRNTGSFLAVRTYTVDLFGGIKTRYAVRTG